MSAGVLANTVGYGSAVADLIADYMSSDFAAGLSAEALQHGFSNTLKRAGVPDDTIQKISVAIGSSGGFDRFVDLYKNQLGER